MARHWRDGRLIKLGEEMFSSERGILEVKERVKEELNKGKVGRPYKYPRLIIHVGTGLSKFLPYRQVSGALRSLYGYAPYYVTLRKGIIKEAEHWECKKIRG